MKKVFLVHGFNSSPNSSWLPWIMNQLKRHDIYACSLPMPKPQTPIRDEWVGEITKWVNLNKDNEIYLIGHSLGSAAILNYLQKPETDQIIDGVILVSGRCQKSDNPLTANFYENFNFEMIKSRAKRFVVIHGDDDTFVFC